MIPESGCSTGGTISPSFLVSLQYGAVRCYFPHLFENFALKPFKFESQVTWETEI